MLAQDTYIDNNGKLAIPAKIRKLLKLKAGDKVTIQYNEQELVVSTFHSNLEKARDVLAKYGATDLLRQLKIMRADDASKE
jgi:AbrB family looped-hinge helix DNA binding protein